MSHNILRRIGILLIVFLLIWILVQYMLPIALPFLLAGCLALAAEPLVSFFHNRLHLRRGLAAGLGVCIALTVAALVVLTLCALLLRELGLLAGVLPDLEGTAIQGIHSLEDWLLGLARQTPDGIRPILTHGVEGMFSDGTQFLDQIFARLLGFASGLLMALPDSALGIGTWVIASFMISAKLPNIRALIHRHLPSGWHETYLPALKRLKQSIGGWLLAQLKLVGVTLCVLTVGFLVLQIPYAPLWAAAVSLVDALPILGTGTVLIPWSLVCFLQGDTLRAVGLLGTYAAVSLIRSVLEPRLVGKQLGLDPLVTLIALYAGYQFWGIGGMILAPLIAVTATQLAAIPRNPQA